MIAQQQYQHLMQQHYLQQQLFHQQALMMQVEGTREQGVEQQGDGRTREALQRQLEILIILFYIKPCPQSIKLLQHFGVTFS